MTKYTTPEIVQYKHGELKYICKYVYADKARFGPVFEYTIYPSMVDAFGVWNENDIPIDAPTIKKAIYKFIGYTSEYSDMCVYELYNVWEFKGKII